MTPDESKHRHVLILRTSALGDVAMTIPVIYSAAWAYPDVQFSVLTKPFFGRLFINAPANVECITIDYKTDYKGLQGMRRLLRRLGGLNVTDVADFHDILRSWMIDIYFRFKGIRVSRLKKDRVGRAELLKNKEPQIPYIERYRKVLNSLGFNFEMRFKSLFGDQPPQPPIDVVHPAVGIAPFARYESKAYPFDLVKLTVQQLVDCGLSVYLFGAKGDEQQMLGQLAQSMERVVNVAGRFSIDDELRLMANLDVMVSMDSANHHMASLVGTPVISIWGGTVPYGGFMGYNQSQKNAMCANIDCQPCSVAGSADCPLAKDYACLRALSPKSIVSRIMAVLDTKK